jgi:hypothetical protein
LYRPLTSRRALSKGDTRARDPYARRLARRGFDGFHDLGDADVFHTRTAFESTLSALALFMSSLTSPVRNTPWLAKAICVRSRCPS